MPGTRAPRCRPLDLASETMDGDALADRDERANHREVPAMTQPPTSSEAADLMGYLTKQREHVLGILENLPEEAMRRPVLPTGWTCAGLVQHLALDQ